MSTEAKQTVHEFWQRASCGEEAYAVAARVNVLGRRPVRATCDQSVGRGGNVSAVAGLNSYQPGPPCRTPHPCMGPPHTRRRQSRPYSRGRTESAPCRRKYDIAPTRALLTAPANGRRGRPTDILRGHQAGNLRGRAQFGLSDEEAMAPGQSASRVAPHCHDRLTRS
jgi:hypothetical protein